MLRGTCHCGAVVIELPRKPERITSCNCSICRRLGSLMAYYRPDEVVITGDATEPYVWGDEMLAFHRCRACGCMTHWLGLGATAHERMGVNVRMMDPADIEGVPLRRFDGADTWKYLDE